MRGARREWLIVVLVVVVVFALTTAVIKIIGGADDFLDCVRKICFR